MAELFNLFYVSEAVGADASQVTTIADQSQENNRRDAITGLLLFDGSCWCQYVEGPQASVNDLHDRLRRDPRHRDMQVRQQGLIGGERLFPRWRMGFAYVADEAAIRRVAQAEGAGAMEAFQRIDYAVDEDKYGS